MRTILAVAAGLALSLPTNSHAGSKTIDLRTRDGVSIVKGEWRYTPVKLVEVAAKEADGTPTPTYNIEPKAFGADFDDSKWEIADPTTLKNSRGGGQVCFAWYRIKITIPDEAAGKTVIFQTTVDDYGEVWVDGKLDYKVGQVGGPIVAGFNVPNRVELKNVQPGQVVQIAVFGINGPISRAPGNKIFLGPTFLELSEKGN